MLVQCLYCYLFNGLTRPVRVYITRLVVLLNLSTRLYCTSPNYLDISELIKFNTISSTIYYYIITYNYCYNLPK